MFNQLPEIVFMKDSFRVLGRCAKPLSTVAAVVIVPSRGSRVVVDVVAVR